MPGTFGRFLAAAAAIYLLAIAPVHAEDKTTDQAIRETLGDPAIYRSVIEALQAAVKAHDAAGVARLVSYPIGVTIHGKKTTIPDARAFVANYDAIVTPAIAAVVENEAYEDLFVNWQGIMFGSGDVWINGICRDKACKSFDAKVVTIQAGASEAPPPAAAVVAQAGELKSYKDWVIGCDNARACVALGMTADDDSLSAYVRIARDGAADAAPAITFVVYPPDNATAPLKQPAVRLSLDAHKSGGLPANAMPIAVDGDLYRLALPAEAVPDLLAALRSATSITVDLQDDGKTVSTQKISLAGSSAALLQMDDQQKRLGTMTALARKGDAGADTIAPVPALPVVKSLPIADLGGKLPKPPHGLAKPSPDCSSWIAPYVAYDLGGDASLWGSCASSGAYNLGYDYSVVRDGKARPWSAVVPGVKGDDPSWLWNASVDDISKTLSAFFKGRGLGDCGDATEWAYDGQNFAALSYRAMNACRGVLQEDWPVLYRARTE
jgi:invasion protein IalB